MSSLGSAVSQTGTGEIQASQSYQPGGRTTFWPFSGKLGVDEELKLSHENFKQSIDDFYKDKIITPLSQLTTTPLFPTPHVLAQFASKAYEDYKPGENDEHYEARLALPEGWKLLTTASNGSKTNGYFGAAYWHPEYQQVVIAHRGTKITNMGALWTNVFGVGFENHVPQMGSASTFSHKVVEVLQEVHSMKSVSFQLFFTGHGLGGWLAQITTLTTEYLSRETNISLNNKEGKYCFHPHTVVFDSPGCKYMLSEMRDKLNIGLSGFSTNLKHLDITNYRSAPNRINTYNTHLGTVYRIFTDLSDMRWRHKHTPLYNLATHSMDKILQVFDPGTGQVGKDEEGQPKILVVVDWPSSRGLTGGEEYNSFFKWANHLNNYHPDMTDVSLRSVQVPYQTKPYKERVHSLSVFSQEEQQFLQHYSLLRQWPELFKLKYLFTAMDKNKAQEEAVNILQSFEIKKDRIRCTDASELQALIPYVKRLLQLFPEIKEKTKRAVTSDDTINRYYQHQTRHYLKQINKSPLDFKPDDLRLTNFVRSDHQVLQLQLVDGDEWTGLIKVYQVLQKNGCLIEGQYTILKLNSSLSIEQLMDFSKMMQSTVTSHLLLMACEDNHPLDEETKNIITTLFSTIKHKPSIQVILSTGSETSTLHSLQQIGREIFGKAFVARDEQLTWRDLTTSSQEKLLEKSVKFQGAKISLNEIMTAVSPAANFLPLFALLQENELKIADSVPIANAQNEIYYIGKTFRRKTAIKQDIVWDRCKEKIPDFLVRTEEEFKQVSQNNTKDNVHWLEKDRSGKLLWQKSQGSLATLRRYIDTDSSHTYTLVNLDNLLEQAQHQRVMLISDTAGMGKSTVLTYLSKQIKQKFPAKWVVRIDLNDHTDALNALKQEQIDKERAIDFVSQKLLKLELGLEVELFKQGFEEREKLKIIIMLDGCDEISPSCKETIIDLLQALRQTAVEQLWVTTQPHLKEELEDQLQQLCYTIEHISE